MDLYSLIDGTWHAQEHHADGSISTACGLEVPTDAEWTRHQPAEDLCDDCVPDQPKKKAKKAKA